MSTPTTSDARLDFRLPGRLKDTIEEAAALRGQTISDFALSALLEKAEKVLDAERIRVLSGREAKAFFALLDSDEEPSEGLRKSVAWYKENYDGPVDD